MSNQLLNKFKTIDLSRRRLQGILQDKGVGLSSNSLPALVEEVSGLNVPDYTPDDWTGVAIEPMPEDYYVPEVDFNAIYEADTDKANYTNVAMYIIDCTEHDFNLPQNAFQSFQKYKFSDTNVLTSPARNLESPAHTWNKTKDIIGSSGKKYRWVMGYSNTQNLGVDHQGMYFMLDAIIVFKGSYGTFSMREDNNAPAYIEIKKEVSQITTGAGGSGYNDILKTVICNAPIANLSDSTFRGCTKLYMVYWNSISNTACSWTFTDCAGLRWLYIKQNAHCADGTFQRMKNCYIQIDTLTGQLGSTSSYGDSWPLTGSDNLRIKIGKLTNLYRLCTQRYSRNSNYFDTGDNFMEIDLITKGTIYDNMNENKWPKLRIHEINACTLYRYAFRYNNNLYPEIKFTGQCVFNQGDGYSQTFELNETIQKIDMSEATVSQFYNNIFAGATNLETLLLPNGLTTLPNAMIFKTKIRSLVMPDSITSVDGQCLRGATELESVYLSSSLTTIPGWLFAGLKKFKQIIIPESVTLIDTAAFLDTIGLKEITIPQNVKRIGVQSFKNSGINSVTIQGENVTINSRAFMDCTNLKTMDLSNVSQIDEYAFENTAFDHLVIPANGGVFNTYAFVNTNAKSIVFEEGFEPTQNIDISYSDITNATVLELLYSLPDLTGKTTRQLTIGPTCEIPTNTAGYRYYDHIKSKTITVNDDGLVWDNSGSMTVAQYIASKNWTVV